LQALQPAKTFHFLKVVKMLFEAFYLSATGEKVLDERKGIWRLQFYNVLTQIVFLVLFSISSYEK
jgi:hypothetical protein